jgi:hypothetical protein
MKLRLCIPPIVLCILDQSITLLGQHSQYWKDNYQTAMEGCPPFHWLLQQHPLAFEAGIAVWIAFFSTVILLSPRWLAMAISIAIVIGHTWGTSTWLLLRFGQGYWLCIALFLMSGLLASLCYQQHQDKPLNDTPVSGERAKENGTGPIKLR